MMHSVGPWFRLRLGLLFVLFMGALGLVAFRLVQLQVWVNPQLEALAKRQFEKQAKKTAFRLPIVDRNGEELAVSVPSGSVFVRPRLVTRRRDTARRLAKWLGGDPKHWLEKLKSPKPFVWLQRQVNEATVKEISDANLPGVYVESENKRVYPNEELAAATIGFTDIDGRGLSGLELALNDRLLPRDQRFLMVRDGKGNPSYLDRGYVRESNDASFVRTNLDRRVQHIVEEELKQALEDTEAKGAFAVVMDPNNGNILALAQRPAFDANRFSQFPASSHYNMVISGLFEPGSTLKAVLAAEAMEQGILSAASEIDCGDGEITIGNKRIREAEASHRYHRLKLRDVIAYSSNVGAIRVGQALGSDRLRFALDKFGLTSKTGVLFPGEAATAPKSDGFWTPFALASASFGQGISSTPLQMVAAYAPFANGGYWVRPRLLTEEWEREIRRRVISFATAEKMKQILIHTTEDEKGTGRPARVPGVRVAGKTGTAQKFVEGTGYSGGKYYSSFIGFLPADHPELLIGVMLDEPKKGYYASALAAPLFRRIAERSLAVLGAFPRKEMKQEILPVARAVAPTPPPIAPLVEKSAAGLLKMPDLKGLSQAEAIHLLGKNFTSVQISGNGYLSDQSPAAGSWIALDSGIHLHFAPRG